jgi:hypothetical protein
MIQRSFALPTQVTRSYCSTRLLTDTGGGIFLHCMVSKDSSGGLRCCVVVKEVASCIGRLPARGVPILSEV